MSKSPFAARHSPFSELDSLVRRVDEDRWLASRFAPAGARARLIALYAVNYEIARTAEVVREAPLGDIRLEWWRGALADLTPGAAQERPALAALAGAFPAAAPRLRAIAEVRRIDLDPAPFATWADVDRYVDGTAGELMRLAMEACAPEVGEDAPALAWPASQAWGYAGLLRSAPFWEGRGRSVFPREGGGRQEMLLRAEAACIAARWSRPLPSAMFPAVGYAALLPLYLRALRADRREPSLFTRQWRLIAAAARGRL